MRKIFLLFGPTACGKTSVGIELVKKFSSLKIINGDAYQIYSELPILTARPPICENHLLYGHRSIFDDQCNVKIWIDDVLNVINNNKKNGLTSVIIGGSGMYFWRLFCGLASVGNQNLNIRKFIATLVSFSNKEFLIDLLKVLDPAIDDKVFQNHLRIRRALECIAEHGIKPSEIKAHTASFLSEFDVRLVIINQNFDVIQNAIHDRFLSMIQDGLMNEIQSFSNVFAKKENNLEFLHKPIGLMELLQVVNGSKTLEDAQQDIELQTRKFARTQLQWCKKLLNMDSDRCLAVNSSEEALLFLANEISKSRQQ